MITALFWDIDGTILDFLAAEKAAIRSLFAELGLGECTDEMIARYSAINKKYWRLLEDGVMTKPEILVGRFSEFFAGEGIVTDADLFNETYQVRLGDTVVFIDRADELLRRLKAAGIRQYAVTNGTRIAQRKKLTNAHLWEVFDGVFISDEIGAEKPSKAFFDHVFATVKDLDRDEVMIVGDSLSSDMRGGLAAGIRTCWYNPAGASCPVDLPLDEEIHDLWQVQELLARGKKEESIWI
ncbi:MAG: YjjG family noncanonical pyrimidine nucleotidase [Clostridia bacterium]|nr:YjjG family noncanonical pyrimidine nucleotidase [Clostridia bacterium]